MNILIDARRKINSGVGRVSQWVANNVPLLFPSANFKFLITTESQSNDYNLKPDSCIECGINPFSEDEFYALPLLIDSFDFDLYITPQTTWSPLIKTPSITMIHDLWAINNPEWLPSDSDLMHRFNLDNTFYFDLLNKWFEAQDPYSLLTIEGERNFEKAVRTGNRIHKGAWAQYAAMINYSSATVTVSSFINEEIYKFFSTKGRVIKNIPNVASSYIKANSEGRSRDILLTLSKIENRKNLDYLLDEYITYASNTATPLPLVIAGDPGYKSVSDKLKGRVNLLQQKGFSIDLLPSVPDRELRNLFSKTACMLFPTHFEGFGLPAIEALLSEIPVICTPTGIMKSDLREYGDIITGSSLNQLATKIQGVITNPPSQSDLQKRREAAVKYINQGNSLNLWESIIHNIIDSNRANKINPADH